MSAISTIRKAAVAALKASPLTIDDVTIPVDKIFDSPSFDLDDEEDLPAAIAVYLSSVKAESKSITSQVYEKTYQMVVEVMLEAATDATLADLVSEAEEVVNSRLLADRAWSAGARRVVCEGGVFRQRKPSRKRCAGVDIGYLITIETRYEQTVTGGSSALVHDSPTPKTVAGWKSQE